MKTIACIPCFNEEKTIAKVVIGAQKYVDKVIVCDDGSTDMSNIIAEKLSALVVKHKRNIGYGAGLKTLLSKAHEFNPDIIVTLDADGQHDPEDIPKVTEPIIKGEADLVIGSRFLVEENDIPKYRKIGIQFLTEVINLTSGIEIKDAQSGFRAYSRKALDVLNPTELGMGLSGELLLKASKEGLNIIEVPVRVYYEGLESSTHNPIWHGLEVLTAVLKHFSINHPLLVYGLPSFALLFIGFIFGLWATRIYLYDRQFPMGLALVASFSIIVGSMLGITAIILYTILSVIRERG